MATVVRRKVYPVIDGTEFYVKASVYLDVMDRLRLELLKSRAQVRALQASNSRLVTERAKARDSNPAERRAVRHQRDEWGGKRRHASDALDQGDNVISIHDLQMEVDD